MDKMSMEFTGTQWRTIALALLDRRDKIERIWPELDGVTKDMRDECEVLCVEIGKKLEHGWQISIEDLMMERGERQ